jgi:hypothetical protein
MYPQVVQLETRRQELQRELQWLREQESARGTRTAKTTTRRSRVHVLVRRLAARPL